VIDLAADGVYPEKYFQQRVSEEAYRSKRLHTILTLVLVQGDTPVLAHTLRGGIRRMDVLGLWKEYLGILMSEAPREEVAPVFSERLTQQAQGVLRVAGVVDTEWQEIHFGACLMPEDKSGKIEVEQLLNGAEKAVADSAREHQPILYKGAKRFIDSPRKDAPSNLLRFGDLHLDRDNHKAWAGSQSVEFLPKEYDLLLYMIKNQGKLLKRDHLCKSVWGHDYFGSSRTVDMHIAKLRKKLKPSRSITIRTLKGDGYRLDLAD
jgi:hypothetical protein